MTVVRELEVLITGNVSSLTSGLNTANNSVAGFSQKTAGQMASVGIAITAAAAPFGVFAAAGIQAAADFDSAMADISARTGLVGDDLKLISDYALQMGADTAFSAQQASDAMLQLMTSGQSAEEAMATLPAVMTLAAASGMDLGAAADSVTDIMAAFGLGVEESTMVVDALAQASGASSASAQDLAAAFANVGGVAAMFGLDVETTAATLAVFAENGTKGAEAGTLLKSVLLGMNSERAAKAFDELGVSLYNVDGSARDFETVIGELDTALDALPVEEQNRLMVELGGSYGIVGLSALRGSVSIGEMEDKMGQAADAATVAEARMNTFEGRISTLQGSVETLQIQAFTPFINQTLTPMIAGVTNIVNGIGEWAAANPNLSNTLIVIGGAALIVGPAMVGIAGAMTVMATAAGSAVLPFGLLAIGMVAFAGLTDWEGVKEGFEGMADGLERMDSTNITTQIDGIREYGAALGEFVAAIPPGQIADELISSMNQLFGTEWVGVGEGFAAWGDNFANAWLIVRVLFDEIRSGLDLWMLTMQLQWATFVGTMRESVLSASGGAIDIAPNFTADTDALRVEIAKLSIKDRVIDELQAQVAGATFDPLKEMEFTVTDLTGKTTTLRDSLVNILKDPDMILAMGTQGRMAVEEALTMAMVVDDDETITLLKPVAVEMGINIGELETDVKAQIAEGDYDTFVNVQLKVNTAIQIIGDTAAKIQSAIAGSSIGDTVDWFADIIDDATGGVDTGGGIGGSSAGDSGNSIAGGSRNSLPPSGGGRNSISSGGSSSGGAAPVFNIYSYGSSPRELIDMIEGLMREKGYGPARRQGAF
jgi:TP901 family phage tail tape measure protein